jgi:hypothetical protein
MHVEHNSTNYSFQRVSYETLFDMKQEGGKRFHYSR